MADEGACRLLQFTIGAGGRLRAGPPRPDGRSGGVAVSPDGTNAYVIVGGWIKRFAVGADGRLDPDSLISVNTGGDLTDVALTPDGAHLFAASRDGRVFQLRSAAMADQPV